MDMPVYNKKIEDVLKNHRNIDMDSNNISDNINLLIYMFINFSKKYKFKIKNASQLWENMIPKIMQHGISDNIDIVFLTGAILHNSDLNISQRFLDYLYNNYREHFYKVGCGVFGFFLLQPIDGFIIQLINTTAQRMIQHPRFMQYLCNRGRIYDIPKRLKQIYLYNNNIQFTVDLIIHILPDREKHIFLEAYNE